MSRVIRYDVGVDLARLRRGVQLSGERVSDGRYRVVGGDAEHWVDLDTPNHPRCDCGDHLWRDALCKHILLALLYEGDSLVVEAVGDLVRQLAQEERPHAA
ncbi:MAG TPA: SWIM zinc finger family protein [Gemmatimonadaceae bacterium]|nr:SWIM zinc finger family protein [Gemmatimonadaceae bacterium]